MSYRKIESYLSCTSEILGRDLHCYTSHINARRGSLHSFVELNLLENFSSPPGLMDVVLEIRGELSEEFSALLRAFWR